MRLAPIILGMTIVFNVTLLSATPRHFQVQYLETPTRSSFSYELLTAEWIPGNLPGDTSRIRKIPAQIVEHREPSPENVVTLSAPTEKRAIEILTENGVQFENAMISPSHPFEPPLKLTDDLPATTEEEEVVTILSSGDPANRIDLVFMGDGYTLEERDRFFDDVSRLTNEMFNGPTFRSYLPIFNVHAVFRPSQDHGIGRGVPQNTAYGLYREGDTLRAIFPTKEFAARRSCRKAPDCDYPIIMANDDYYGGLGGEFAITTRSYRSGTMVLRHELGHNFGKVGEEYDGGGYFGANYAPSLSQVPWTHWLSEPDHLVAQPAIARFLDWPWHNLSEGPFLLTFESDGLQNAFAIRFSVSGFGDNQISFILDNTPLPILSPGHNDRTFFDYMQSNGFSSGPHQLLVQETTADGDNWLSSLTIHEYGTDYVFDPNYIGAYPLFHRSKKVAGYRPTHETCLMRNMTAKQFCRVCQENNWLHFLKEISLIDAVTVTPTNNGTATYTVQLKTPKLGGLRNSSDAQFLKIRWYHSGQLIEALNDQPEWVARDSARGDWHVIVEFITPEVQNDPDADLVDTAYFKI